MSAAATIGKSRKSFWRWESLSERSEFCFHIAVAFWGAVALAEIGLLLLAYSLLGLYRMYGHPGVRYVRKLVALGDVKGKVTVADLRIGTYRHAFLLSDGLPEAQIKSVDCWNAEAESPEEAVADVRDLEVPPRCDPRIETFQGRAFPRSATRCLVRRSVLRLWHA